MLDFESTFQLLYFLLLHVTEDQKIGQNIGQNPKYHKLKRFDAEVILDNLQKDKKIITVFN